jgi:hypothetical protein
MVFVTGAASLIDKHVVELVSRIDGIVFVRWTHDKHINSTVVWVCGNSLVFFPLENQNDSENSRLIAIIVGRCWINSLQWRLLMLGHSVEIPLELPHPRLLFASACQRVLLREGLKPPL